MYFILVSYSTFNGEGYGGVTEVSTMFMPHIGFSHALNTLFWDWDIRVVYYNIITDCINIYYVYYMICAIGR